MLPLDGYRVSLENERWNGRYQPVPPGGYRQRCLGLCGNHVGRAPHVGVLLAQLHADGHAVRAEPAQQAKALGTAERAARIGEQPAHASSGCVCGTFHRIT